MALSQATGRGAVVIVTAIALISLSGDAADEAIARSSKKPTTFSFFAPPPTGNDRPPSRITVTGTSAQNVIEVAPYRQGKGFTIRDRRNRVMLDRENSVAVRQKCKRLDRQAFVCAVHRIHTVRIWGGEGNDVLRVHRKAAKETYLEGKQDHDRIFGANEDLLLGGPGRDLVVGGPGDDFVGGGTGEDEERGGAGHDYLGFDIGGDMGVDTLMGGSGGDELHSHGDETRDRVLDCGTPRKTTGFPIDQAYIDPNDRPRIRRCEQIEVWGG